MLKAIIAYIAIFIIGAVAFFYALNDFIYNEKQGESMENSNNQITNSSTEITPISHATFVLNFANKVIFNDPVGGREAFAGQSEPDIILISDIHGDHLSVEAVQSLATERTKIIAPKAVADQLPDTIPGNIIILNNGETQEIDGIKIEAIPMYNVPESVDAYHTKGRGNGYILEAGGERVYIAGDTGPIPEMKALQNIDIAFIPMNLPYTMNIQDAASAVIAFAPKKVIPYHYRGQEGLADTNKFKQLVNEGNSAINVELLNFYPEE